MQKECDETAGNPLSEAFWLQRAANDISPSRRKPRLVFAAPRGAQRVWEGPRNAGYKRDMETIGLAALSPSALTQRLYELRREERRLLVEFLHYLGELSLIHI